MRRLAQTLLRIAPIAPVVVAGGWFLLDWVVDDAAISFAYARSAAHGHGLTSQPGRLPVEGFSNPLWVGLLSTMAWTPSLPPHLALKVLSWTCQTAFLGVAAYSTAARSVDPRVGGVFAALLALEPPLLIWSNSGLETPLLLLASMVLAEALIESVDRGRKRAAVLAGTAAAACALTRPECALLAAGGFATLLMFRRRAGTIHSRVAYTYLVTWVVPCCAYLAFRRIYFRDWLPNTFYAKGGLTAPRLLDAITLAPHAIVKVLEIGEALAGYFGATFLLAVVVGLALRVMRLKALSTASRVYIALFLAALVAYVVLPGDWMGEFRYAALAALLLSMATFHLLADLWHRFDRRKVSPRVLACFGVGLAATATLWITRISAFGANPPMPLSEVIGRSHLFASAGSIVGVSRPSILTQDVGGFLLEDELDLYDIGMLTDRRIARDIGDWREVHDRHDLHAYVFEDVRPDFISVAAYHAWAARLDEDYRLRRDYTPISVKTDEWALHRYGVVLESGSYVRSERLRDAQQLETLRSALSGLTLP